MLTSFIPSQQEILHKHVAPSSRCGGTPFEADDIWSNDSPGANGLVTNRGQHVQLTLMALMDWPFFVFQQGL